MPGEHPSPAPKEPPSDVLRRRLPLSYGAYGSGPSGAVSAPHRLPPPRRFPGWARRAEDLGGSPVSSSRGTATTAATPPGVSAPSAEG